MDKDPYKYFRIEAVELVEGLTQGVQQLGAQGASGEVIARLLRLAHTLKGAARVVKQPKIAEHAHAVEEVLARHRDGESELSSEHVGELLQRLDDVSRHVEALTVTPLGSSPEVPEPCVEAGRTAEAVTVSDVFDTLRIETQDLQVVLRGLSEAELRLARLRARFRDVDELQRMASTLVSQLGQIASERSESWGPCEGWSPQRALNTAELLGGLIDRFQSRTMDEFDRVEVELADVRENAGRLQLVPVQSMFGSLERVVRDAARGLGKRVAFAAGGADVRLEARVLTLLRDALTHVTRNAVTHGIESEEARVVAGKPAIGRVTLSVDRDGRHVVFTCADDGRGIDADAVRAAATAAGLLPRGHSVPLQGPLLVSLLSTPGLTTASSVTELSGRGVGLDVVRASLSALEGELSIATEAGRGTKVTLRVPIDVASLDGLIVGVGTHVATIPLDAVRQTLRVSERDLLRSASNDAVMFDGVAIPFAPLASVVPHLLAANGVASDWCAVVLDVDGQRAALGAERLAGTTNVVMHSLPEEIDDDPVVMGASLDPRGNPSLVLDPVGLVARAGRHRLAVAETARRLPILVVDDSLTTRMLEQSILESAGYEVELAVSAEDALEKVRTRRFGVFVVDVEMPGMDGFEFVARTRADAHTSSTPAILVTSRNADDDKRHAASVGAHAYIVKSEFDQDKLLATIRSLIG